MPARIGNWLIQANWKLLGGLVALFSISALLDYCAYFLALGLAGIGGIITPLLVVSGPLSNLIFVWPFLVTLANTPLLPVRTFVKTVTCIYYVWLVLQPDFTLGEDFAWINAHRIGHIFFLWALMTLLLHALIWLPFPLLKALQKCQMTGELNLALQK